MYWSEMTRKAIKCDFWSSKMAAVGHFVKKKSCIGRICVQLGMSTSSNNTISWCLYRVNTPLQLQPDLLLPQFIQYFFLPIWLNLNIQIIMLSLTPKSRFTTLWHSLWSLNHALLPIIGLMGDCLLYTYSFSHPFKSYYSINSQNPIVRHFNFTTVSLFHLVSESFSPQKSFHFGNSSNQTLSRGHHNDQHVGQSGIYRVFALMQIHSF